MRRITTPKHPEGGYRPFADLITSDGYEITVNREPLSGKRLKAFAVLVIVNASVAPGADSALTDEECDAVRDWVGGGGALLLITDQSPFTAAVGRLSKRFEVDLANGYVIETSAYNKESGDETELVFTRVDGLVVEHPITRGRDQTEQIKRIITFTGTSVKGPPKSVSFLKLAATARDVLPPDPKLAASSDQPSDPKIVSAADRAQGVALEFGEGRVVVLTDAAALTAKIGSRGFRFGMNIPGSDNRQLALNIMHWLSGLLK
ncbi:MAG TPA: DUF4350 domain-containing protein [Blastocatellia bacterium]|nr:DUF4350 domain-containing protein [Blastocatellia bacterium]